MKNSQSFLSFFINGYLILIIIGIYIYSRNYYLIAFFFSLLTISLSIYLPAKISLLFSHNFFWYIFSTITYAALTQAIIKYIDRGSQHTGFLNGYYFQILNSDMSYILIGVLLSLIFPFRSSKPKK